MKSKRSLSSFFADRFILEAAMWVNLAHLGILLLMSFLSMPDYAYRSLRFESVRAVTNLLYVLFRILLPTLIIFAAFLVYRLSGSMGRRLKSILRAVMAAALIAAMLSTLPITLIFKYAMPFCSYTEDPENYRRYDADVLLYPLNNAAPQLPASIPAEAGNVRYSYWYSSSAGSEWKIQLSFELPEAEYAAMRDETVDAFHGLGSFNELRDGSVLSLDTGDYSQQVCAAWSIERFSCDDSSGRLSYELDCYLG